MFDTSVDAAAPKFGIDSLKKQQVSANRVTLCGNSVFVSLPTGFGKSLISDQLLPVCAKALVSLRPSDVPVHLDSVPLISLMQD